MKFTHLTDEEGLIMRSKENCVDSLEVMELAFQNILEEIIEYVIESLCFEAHRAVKLGYFPIDEYVINESTREFEIYNGEDTPSPVSNGDIFSNDERNISQFSVCPRCGQRKATTQLIRHFNTCRYKVNGSSNSDNNGKRENNENYVEDGDNSNGNDSYDRKKVIDVKKPTKKSPNYDTMTPDQKQRFLLKHCGVVTKRTKKPCSNSLTCNKHTNEARDNVRSSIFERFDHLVDGNIEMDTVD